QRPHYEKMGSTIEALFQLEIPLIRKTTKVPFDYGKLEKRLVNKQGYITNDGCHYSVSAKYVDSYVWIKIMANKIQILDNDHRSITEHARLFKKGEHSTHWVDFVDIVV